MLIHLDPVEVQNLFDTCEHQADVLVGIYKLIFSKWDDIKQIQGWPTICQWTNKQLFEKFIAFDQKHHPSVMAGGCWMNSGFSSVEGSCLSSWTVDISSCQVEYNEKEAATCGS